MSGLNPNIIETTDATNTVGTAYTMAVGQTLRGFIGTPGDHDFYKVNLVAGQTYTFAMVSTGSLRVRDPFLRLYDASGTNLVASNDDGLPNENSIFTYTATTSGVYYIDASSLQPTQTGQYGLSVTAGTKADFDSDMIAGIINTWSSWSPVAGAGITVTYGFRDTYSGVETGFNHVSTQQQAAIRTVLQTYSEITNITFQEVNPGGFTNDATILFSDYSANDGAGAYAYYPGSTLFSSVAGDVWLNDLSVSKTSLPAGSYSMYTLYHEIGHALGLSHPGDYNAGDGVPLSYANNAQFVQDTGQYSNMSYWDDSNSGANLGGYGDMPMLYDIAALQLKYGANMTTRTGDTVYGFGSNAGAIYDFALNTAPAICIWDAGGNDTLNASAYFQNQTINLTSGEFSNIGGLTGNVSIAFGATVECAVGGQGSDVITGNLANNILTGGNGVDTLSGLAGDDTLNGDSATARKGAQFALAQINQTYSGDGWSDVSLQRTNFAIPATALTFEMLLRFDSTPNYASRIISYGNDTWDGYGGQDFTLRANLFGTKYEVLVGGQSFDTGLPLSTFVGADPARLSISWNQANGAIAIYLNGTLVKSGTVGAGTILPATATLDIMDGSFQTLRGSIGDIRVWNTVRTAAQIDTNAWAPLTTPASQAGLVANWQLNTALGAGVFADVSGHLGNLTPVSVTATNTPATQTFDFASRFADTLLGGDGNDVLSGDQGNDVVNGGAGNDTASYETSSSRVQVNLGVASAQDTLGAGFDTLISIESLIGSAFDDTLQGNTAANLIVGGAGNDVINGRAGADIARGGAGNDTYYVDHANDVVEELVSGGTADRLYASVDYTLAEGVYVETLQLTGLAATNGAQLTGNSFANTLAGGAGNDTLSGGGGNDRLFGLGGTNQLYGGLGNDLFYVETANNQIFESAGEGTSDIVFTSVSFALAAGQEIEGLRAWNNASSPGITLTGNEFANIIYGGTTGNDTLIGGGGGDRLYGLGGNDRLIGGAGVDGLYGGAGNDVFVLQNLTADRDSIADFTLGADILEVSRSLFGNFDLGGGVPASSWFRSNTTGAAGDGDDRFIYNSASGALYFDGDGSGAGSRVQIASFVGLPALSAASFTIVA